MGFALLMLAPVFIIIGSFCIVFALDKNRPANVRKKLFFAALLCTFAVWGLIIVIMTNPLLTLK